MFTVYNGKEYQFTETLIYNGEFVSGITTRDIRKTDDSNSTYEEDTGEVFRLCKCREMCGAAGGV